MIELTEVTSLGRFTRVASGELMSPGQCGICGAYDRPEGFVDTKIDVEFLGVLYICNECVFEMTRVFPDSPYADLRHQLIKAQTDLALAKNRIVELEGMVDGFAAAWSDSRNNSVTSDRHVRTDESIAGAASNDAVGPSDEPRKSDPGPVKSVTSTKPSNIDDIKRSNPSITDV